MWFCSAQKPFKPAVLIPQEAELFGLHIVALSVGSTKCVVVSSNKVVEVWDVLTLERLATTAVRTTTF